MMSTCFNPMAANKMVAVIPEDKMIDFAIQMTLENVECRETIGRLYDGFFAMHRELGSASSEVFHQVSSVGIMAKIALLPYPISDQVCRLVDLMVMRYAYELHKKLDSFEIILGNVKGDYVLDFDEGWTPALLDEIAV